MALTPMGEYLIRDPVFEFQMHIDKLHLGYLQMPDSPQKIEHRLKLESVIEEYLSIVPPQRKFLFRETAQVLYRSAALKKDFSGYRAAVAWNAINMYAANLLVQPWRGEYRQIKLYSGFYKHHVEAHLDGGELMLEAMGYRPIGDGVVALDGPVCPDRAEGVSRDALLAHVECQILKRVWERLQPSVTWLRILEFRQQHACSAEQATIALSWIPQQVPTARLIDVGSTAPGTPTTTGTAENGGGSWEYVYQGLKRRGYSKDAGRRGDILQTGEWNCAACTYLNTRSDVCEMCSKSRACGASAPPLPPSAVGGSQCPRCTLINDRHVATCDACGSSLARSPTYI